MRLTFSSDIEAMDNARRTISGKILPFGNEVGHTNVGKVVFEDGSVQYDDAKKVKFLLEHDAKKPLGRAVNIEAADGALYATFKVANTTRGNDALIEASENLRSGLSVGVEVLDSKNVGNVIHVLAARLEEVSLVSSAAFKSAAVTEVAASEAPAEEVKEEITTNESEALVENTPESVAPEAVETPAVEASRPTVSVSAAYTKPIINVTNEAYLENTVKAALGDDSARQWLRAASDTDTTDVAGLVPTRQLTEIINGKTTAVRPTIDAISSGVLPDAGLKFQIPRVKTAPVVTAGVAEGGAFGDTQVEIEYVDVDVKKAAGMQLFDVEVLDRTSPAFFAELQSLMADAYAKSTNAAAVSAIQTGATADGTAITLPWDGAEMAGFIARASDSIYSNTLKFAQAVIVSPTQWSNIMGMVDSSNRPLFVASQPQNAAGSVSQSLRGSLLGLDLYVDYTLTGVADGSLIVVNRDCYTWYESPRLQLRADKVGTGKVEVGYYGYYAIATKIAAGAFKFNNAA
jgi:HK97 family phage major capsid protein